MTPTILILLRIVHVLATLFWAGTVLLNALFVLPSVRAAGPAGGAVMRQLTQVRQLPLWLTAASWLALVSGLLLYWRASMGFMPAWMASPQGLAFGIGGLMTIGVMASGQLVNAPAARRLGALGAQVQQAGGPPAPDVAAEMGRLQARLLRATQWHAVLLGLVAALMAAARYL